MKKILYIVVTLMFLLSIFVIQPLQTVAASQDDSYTKQTTLDSWKFQIGYDPDSPDPSQWQDVTLAYKWYLFDASPDGNLIGNPGFETGELSPWYENNATGTIASDEKHSGDFACLVSNRALSWHTVEQLVTGNIAARGKGLYEFSVWIKLAPGSAPCQVSIDWYGMDGSPGQVIYGIFDEKTISVDDGWVQFSGVSEITWTGALQYLKVYIETPGEAPFNSFYFDDCYLAKLSGAPLELDAIGNKNAPEGSMLSFSVSAAGGDGAYTYSATGLPDGADFIPESGLFSWTPPTGSAGDIYDVTFTVIDGAGAVVSETIRIVVIAPEMRINLLTDNPDFEETGRTFVPQWHPYLGGQYWYANACNVTLETDLLYIQSGDQSAKVTDRAASWAALTYEVGDLLRANGPGWYDASGWIMLPEDVSDAVTLSIITYELTDERPEYPGTIKSWPTIESKMVNGGAYVQFSGSVEVKWDGELSRADLSTGTETSACDMWLDNFFLCKNSPPTLAPIGNKNVEPGEELSFTINAYDIDGDALIYSINGIPAGASFNAATCEFSWSPMPDDVEIFEVTFAVSDGKNETVSETISITVTAPTPADIITVAGVDISFELINGVVVLKPSQAQITAILNASGNTIVFDLSNQESADIYFDAAWFMDVDKTISIITANGSADVKTKSLWNNSGKQRLITVRDGKLSFKNI